MRIGGVLFKAQYREVDSGGGGGGPAEWTTVGDLIPSDVREWRVGQLVTGKNYRWVEMSAKSSHFTYLIVFVFSVYYLLFTFFYHYFTVTFILFILFLI